MFQHGGMEIIVVAPYLLSHCILPDRERIGNPPYHVSCLHIEPVPEKVGRIFFVFCGFCVFCASWWSCNSGDVQSQSSRLEGSFEVHQPEADILEPYQVGFGGYAVV